MQHTHIRAGIAASAAIVLLAGCSGGGGGGEDTSSDDAVRVAVFEGGYGSEGYEQVVAAYEELNPDVDIELETSRTIAQELTPQVAAGDYPDLVMLGLGQPEGFTESFVRDRALEPLTDVLDLQIPGEDVTVGEKLTPGIVGNLSTNPYGDDEVYLMPINASPTGLMYNQTLFAERGWDVPTTWDEFLALGETAEAEGISLFTYPTSGYLDSYFFALSAVAGGPEFANEIATYETDVWQSDEAIEMFELTGQLLDQAAPATVGYANAQDFSRNQQAILDGTTLFMPNGTWIANEMEAAPRTEGFEWGLMPVPAIEEGGERYVTTFVESAWIPAEAEHVDEAQEFLAFFYSDQAADIMAEAGAIQPIEGITDRLTGDNAAFYAAYDEENVLPFVGNFAATSAVPGVDIRASLFATADSYLNGQTSLEQWRTSVSEASNRLTDAVER